MGDVVTICYSLWPSSWTSSYVWGQSLPPITGAEKSCIDFPASWDPGLRHRVLTLPITAAYPLQGSSSPMINQKTVTWGSEVTKIPSLWGAACKGGCIPSSGTLVLLTTPKEPATRAVVSLSDSVDGGALMRPFLQSDLGDDYWSRGLQTWFANPPTDSVNAWQF